MADDAYNAEAADDGSETPPSGLMEKLRGWFTQDRDARIEWAKEAEMDYAWSSPGGEGQWEEADRLKLKAAGKPCITFNRILPVIQAVCGMEINDRKEVKFLPRTTQNEPQPEVDPATGQPSLSQPPVPGADDTGPAETLSAAADYLRDQCDAEDEESDAFQDTVTCGMGWVETRVDYETNPDGELREDRLDSLEMVWDCKATKRNLIDARRVWRVREVDKDEAKQTFPDKEMHELDAAWARLPETTQPHDREAARYYDSNEMEYDPQRKTVTLVEGQYWEFKTAYKVANAMTGEVQEVEAKQIKNLKANAKAAGIPLSIAKHNKKVIYTCVIGADVLEYGQAQSQECFKFQAITGYRDRNNHQWVGLVRAMRDPQRWANALFSSVLHQIQVSGKGVMMEKDAVDDIQKAERDWGNAAKIVWVRTGALGQHPKIKQKDQNSIPPGTFDLMQFAIGAFRDVTGVNIEMMGLADRQQAASLDLQRKQAGAMILAPFFDGMRRYRKDNGRLVLDLIRNFLSDGRLVRIVGPDYEKYVPLIKQDDTAEYDIIIDESASSPNQKQMAWEILQQMLPVVGKNAGPQVMAAYMKASPLPKSVVDEIQEAAKKESENAPPPPEMIQAQMAQEQHQFDMQAQAQKGEMEGQKMQADLQIKGIDVQIEMLKLEQIKMQNALNIQAKQMDMQGQAEQREHEMGMRQAEFDAEDSKEAMTVFGKDMPNHMKQMMEAQMMQSQALSELAQSLQAVAQALLAPKVSELSPDGSTAVTRPLLPAHGNGSAIIQ